MSHRVYIQSMISIDENVLLTWKLRYAYLDKTLIIGSFVYKRTVFFINSV